MHPIRICIYIYIIYHHTCPIHIQYIYTLSLSLAHSAVTHNAAARLVAVFIAQGLTVEKPVEKPVRSSTRRRQTKQNTDWIVGTTARVWLGESNQGGVWSLTRESNPARVGWGESNHLLRWLQPRFRDWVQGPPVRTRGSRHLRPGSLDRSPHHPTRRPIAGDGFEMV